MAHQGAYPHWSKPVPPPPGHPPGAPRGRRPHWRPLTWVILAFNLLMLLWLVAGVNAASSEGEKCVGKACEAGNDIGTLIGTGVILFFWMAGAVILAVIWLVTNANFRRDRR
ncbi:hypothetical protein [Streptomyces sp. NPDC029674]|uniref:hypothetical protein n=1 Tax=Streptomyces sp. NPDC029674 TaxID=3365297 RepID=UPI00384EDAC5